MRSSCRLSGRAWLHRIATVFLLSVVAACGGGGGGSAGTGSGAVSAPAQQTSSNAPPLTEADAARFLVQATFGPSPTEIDRLVASPDLERWISTQITTTPTFYLQRMKSNAGNSEIPTTAPINMFWDAGVTAPDQLRQRMVYALSQILVASIEDDLLSNRPIAMAYYLDVLSQNALGNYRDLLEAVTYSPAMATYLTYMRNRQANPDIGRMPDENYARELMQLFTIGVYELAPNGERRAGPIETYTNEDVVGLAKVFTGLSIASGDFVQNTDPNLLGVPLQIYPEHHSLEEKTFLGLTIPAGTGAAESIDMALDHLMDHPNVGPFVGRQLIKRFVTSNPTPAYVRRVGEAFDSGTYIGPNGTTFGTGRKGDLAATIAAVLLDDQARNRPEFNNSSAGKIREPTLRFWHWARAFDVQNVDASETAELRRTVSTSLLGQAPFSPSTVFNFYRPEYVAPSSETGDANLTAPELQITDETTHVGYLNFMADFIKGTPPLTITSTPPAYSATYAQELILANNPEALVDRLDILLTSGYLSQETRNRIIDVLNEIDIAGANADEEQRARIHTAIFMIIASPEYIVQR